MKPFNLQEAQAGKPIQTRDGRPARILTTEADHASYPIIALIRGPSGQEISMSFTSNGKTMLRGDIITGNDLFMATTTVTQWINVYPNSYACVHDSKETADRVADPNRVACIEVTYEQ